MVGTGTDELGSKVTWNQSQGKKQLFTLLSQVDALIQVSVHSFKVDHFPKSNPLLWLSFLLLYVCGGVNQKYQ